MSTPHPIKISIPQSEIDHFHRLLLTARLPDDPIVPGAETDDSYGTRLSDLKRAREALLGFKWRDVEERMNRIHFVHERSNRANAVPLLLLHGWPFSFWDFKDVVEPLTNPPPGTQAFHIVIPSLPGVFLSSVVPSSEHSTPDVARIFNTLMVDVLGYKMYGAQGGDFGAINLRQIQLNHADNCKLAHFNGFPAPRPAWFTDEALEKLPDHEKRMLAYTEKYHKYRKGYMDVQTTEVSPLAYAVYDGLGMTSWILSKYLGVRLMANGSEQFQDAFWDHCMTILLSLQYTHSAHTSLLMYKQSGTKYIFDAFGKNSGGAPMGVTLFEGEFFFAPKSWIEESGNLVYYKYHDRGGHAPALAVPDAFVEDLRELFTLHWPTPSKARL